MAKAIKTNKFYQKSSNPISGNTFLVCDNGECFLDSDLNIKGIEINYKGVAEITPELPDGWILQGSINKIIIFTLGDTSLQKTKLFNYIGKIQILSVVLANENAEQVICKVRRYIPSWAKEDTNIDVDTQNWDNKKDLQRKGKVSKTKYNLPDYNLPKVDKKQLKEIRRRTTTATPTYTTGGGSTGGSGGSGGY